MFSAPTGPVARAALFGGAEALEAFSMLVGRPVRPMLAGSAPDVPGAVEKVGGAFAVDTKLDGIRIQVHKQGDEVSVLHPQPRRDRVPAARGGGGVPARWTRPTSSWTARH